MSMALSDGAGGGAQMQAGGDTSRERGQDHIQARVRDKSEPSPGAGQRAVWAR